jgi:hypothetical protein
VPRREDSNDFAKEIWLPRAYLTAGGNTPEIAKKSVEEEGVIPVFGRDFLANVSDRYWAFSHRSAADFDGYY